MEHPGWPAGRHDDASAWQAATEAWEGVGDPWRAAWTWWIGCLEARLSSDRTDAPLLEVLSQATSRGDLRLAGRAALAIARLREWTRPEYAAPVRRWALPLRLAQAGAWDARVVAPPDQAPCPPGTSDIGRLAERFVGDVARMAEWPGGRNEVEAGV